MYYKKVKFSFVLIVLMLLGSFPAHPAADPNETYIKNFVRSSKSCTDSQSVPSGKCSSSLKTLGLQKQRQTKIRPSEILVFVSLSMPPASLKAIHSDLAKVGGRMVVRGLVEGSFKKTQEKIRQLEIAVDVDPLLFDQYGIQRVPVTMSCLSDTEFDLLRGNSRLESVLEEFSEKGSYPLQAIHHLKRLRGSQ
jgi:conjugal transfer pilus assembly protein TrbC